MNDQSMWMRAIGAAVLVGGSLVGPSVAADGGAGRQFDVEDGRGGPNGGTQGGESGKLGAPSDAKVTGVETLDVVMPADLHGQGIAVPAKLVRPKWSKPVGKRPAMVVLHGSGGLLKTPKNKGGNPVCLPEMEGQYVMWADRLAKQGYTVLLPSSYSARGFCDKHDDAGRIPDTFDDKPEQILGRIYDTDAAARYMCSRPEVDCDRMGVMGFSQGGTMTMVALHWQLEHAIQYFRDTKGDDVDIEIPDLAPGRPEFQVGIAYYPGCGFDGVVPLSTSNSAAKENKFMPTAPLTILHGSEDSLIEECSVDHGQGRREIQAGQVSDLLGVDNQYAITVYDGAEHGFDHIGKDGEGDNGAAYEAALAVTMAELANHLK